MPRRRRRNKRTTFKWLLAGAGGEVRAWRCGTGHDCAPASAADFFLGIKKNYVFVDEPLETAYVGREWLARPLSHGVCLRYTSMKSTVFSGLRSKSVSSYFVGSPDTMLHAPMCWMR